MKKKIAMRAFLIITCFSIQSLPAFSQATIRVNIDGNHPYSAAVLKMGFGSFPRTIDSVGFKKGKCTFIIADSIMRQKPQTASISLVDKTGTKTALLINNYLSPGKKESAFYPADTIITITGKYNLDAKAQLFDISRYSEGDVFFDSNVKKVFSYSDTSVAGLNNQLRYIQQHPASTVLMQRILFNRKGYSTAALQKLLKAFAPQLLETGDGAKLALYVENKLREETNAEYTNLILEDKNGAKTKIFDELKGANLIVFWASWCHPCRGEIPLLKNVYANLMSQKADFQITHISADKDKDAWLKANVKEALPWKSLWTPNERTLSDAYNYALPSNFLVTKDKRIHRIDIRDQDGIDALYKALGLKPVKVETLIAGQ